MYCLLFYQIIRGGSWGGPDVKLFDELPKNLAPSPVSRIAIFIEQ